MQRKSPDFTESDYGFSTFGRFLEAAQKTGIVRLIREERSGGYRVDGTTDGENSDASLVTQYSNEQNTSDIRSCHAG